MRTEVGAVWDGAAPTCSAYRGFKVDTEVGLVGLVREDETGLCADVCENGEGDTTGTCDVVSVDNEAYSLYGEVIVSEETAILGRKACERSERRTSRSARIFGTAPCGGC